MVMFQSRCSKSSLVALENATPSSPRRRPLLAVSFFLWLHLRQGWVGRPRLVEPGLKLDKLGETMRKRYVIPRISSSRYVRSNHLLVQRCVAAAHDQQSTARWSGWERGFGSHDLRLGFGVDPLKRQTCAKLKWAAERSTVVTVAPMHC